MQSGDVISVQCETLDVVQDDAVLKSRTTSLRADRRGQGVRVFELLTGGFEEGETSALGCSGGSEPRLAAVVKKPPARPRWGDDLWHRRFGKRRFERGANRDH